MSSDYGNAPYVLWIDPDAFKATSASLLVSMESCGYEKVWKFKNIHRMRVFLQRSKASEFIRAGTQFVVITSNQDMRNAIGALQQSDVVDMLGVLVVLSPSSLLENTCRWVDLGQSSVHKRTVVACNWDDIHSILRVWRTKWKGRPPLSHPPMILSDDVTPSIETLDGLSSYIDSFA